MTPRERQKLREVLEQVKAEVDEVVLFEEIGQLALETFNHYAAVLQRIIDKLTDHGAKANGQAGVSDKV